MGANENNSHSQQLITVADLFDALPEVGCLLDEQGTIVAVNRAWRALADTHGPGAPWFIGVNYLELCKHAEQSVPRDANRIVSILGAILRGECDRADTEYYCPGPGGSLWATASLMRVPDSDPPRVLVLHRESTRRHEDKDSLRVLQRAIEQSRASIVITDRQGNITYVNTAFTAVTGYSREEALGQNPRILKSGKVPSGTYENLWATVSSGRTWQGELTNRAKDGRLYVEHAIISPVVDEAGEIVSYVAVKENLTEKRLVESRLKASEEAFRVLTEASTDVFYRFRLQEPRGFDYLSPSVQKLTGFSPREFMSDPDLGCRLLCAEDIPVFSALGEHLKAGRKIYRMRTAHRDGHLVHSEHHIQPIYDALGNLEAIEGIARAADAGLGDTPGMTGVGSWSCHLATDTVIWSESLYRIFGLDPNLPPPSVAEHDRVFKPESLEKLLAAIRRASTEGVPYELELEAIHSSGRALWVQCHGSPIRDAAGNVTHLTGAARDNTERHLAEQALREQRDMTAAILDTTDALICVARPDGTIALLNKAMERLLGYTTSDLAGKPYWDSSMVLPEEARVVRARFETILRDSRRLESESHRVSSDGRVHLIHWSCSTLRNERGEPTYMISTGLNITQQRAGEARLRLAQRVLESTHEAVMVADATQRIVQVNPAFTAITGFRPEHAIGRPITSFGPGNDDEVKTAMWESIEAFGQWQGEVDAHRRNGDLYAQWLTMSVVRDEEGIATNYVGIFSDISTLKESEDRLEFLAHHDSLTGLPNRVLFLTRLEQSLQRAKRNGGMVALFFIDLDNFKQVNDSLGHAVGDEVLRMVSERIGRQLRGTDTLSRLGGDEFTIILEGIKGPIDAAIAARRILSAFQTPLPIGQHEVFMGGSIGISLFPDDGVDAQELVRHADSAMYKAKEEGRNGFVFYRQEMTDRVQERMRLETALRRAVTGGQLSLCYQPQVQMCDRKLLGLEVLVRWNHPEMGPVPPSLFIPLAEDCGLIVEIGEWVLHEAIRQLAHWRRHGVDVPRLAVNLSMIQIERANVPALVRRALQAFGLPGECLELEVTESVLMKRADQAVEALVALRGMGVSIAIDDFGTGFSSLSYLRRMPVDRLKIDRSFVSGLGQTGADLPIIRSIIALASAMGHRVIAEGVETEDQAHLLEAEGCTEGQGYLFGRPMTALDFEAFLRRQHDELANP